MLKPLAAVPAFSGIGSSVFYKLFSSGSKLASISPFFEGIVFAKHDGLAILKEWIGRVYFKRTLCITGCLTIALCYGLVVREGFMLVYIPLYIAFVSVFIDSFKDLKGVMAFIGKHSTNMWLIHTFYCYYFLEITEIVYSSTNVWVEYLILVTLTLGSSMILDQFWNMLGKLWAKAKGRLQAGAVTAG